MLATVRRLGGLLAAVLVASMASASASAATGAGGESGFLDTRFGSTGIARVPFDAASSAAAAMVLPDRRIVLAGIVDDPDDGATLALARLKPDGSVDRTFGSAGRAVADLAEGRARSLYGPMWGRAALARDPAGRILVAAAVQRGRDGSSRHGIAVARFSPDGVLDPAFGRRGRTVLDFPAPAGRGPAIPYAAPNALALDGSGRILVAGIVERYGYVRNGLALARLDRDGRPDVAFGDRGLVTGPTTARAVAVDGRGRIVVAGHGLIRLLPDGRPDPSFAVTRRNLEAHAVRIRSDDSIEVATANSWKVFDPSGRPRSGSLARPDAAASARRAGPAGTNGVCRTGCTRSPSTSTAPRAAGTSAGAAAWCGRCCL